MSAGETGGILGDIADAIDGLRAGIDVLRAALAAEKAKSERLTAELLNERHLAKLEREKMASMSVRIAEFNRDLVDWERDRCEARAKSAEVNLIEQ